MLIRTLSLAAVFAGVLGAALPVSVTLAFGGMQPPADSQARFMPIQNISYEFGSKMMSGYFVKQAGKCLVTLMVMEKNAADMASMPTAARLRMVLNPGQTTGLDSEEGRSLNVTCGTGASVLLVDTGARDQLVQLQMSAMPREMAGAP